MGQYHQPFNLTKRETITPHRLGDGAKVWEQVASGPWGTASALLFLMAHPKRRGGGDMEGDSYGRWHGDHIVYVGDYAEADDFPPVGGLTANQLWEAGFTDISGMVKADLDKAANE